MYSTFFADMLRCFESSKDFLEFDEVQAFGFTTVTSKRLVVFDPGSYT